MSLITLTLTFYPNPNPNPNPYIDLAHSSRRASLRLAAGLDRMSEAARLSQNPGDVVPSESQQSKRMSFFKGTHSLTHLPIPHLSTYQLTPLPNTHSGPEMGGEVVGGEADSDCGDSVAVLVSVLA